MKPDMLPTVTTDPKHPDMDNEKGESMRIRPTSRRHRPLAIAFASVAFCYLVWTSLFRSHMFPHICSTHSEILDGPPLVLDDKPLVPLEAHIMSKCPDAQVGFTCYSWDLGADDI